MLKVMMRDMFDVFIVLGGGLIILPIIILVF